MNGGLLECCVKQKVPSYIFIPYLKDLNLFINNPLLLKLYNRTYSITIGYFYKDTINGS